MFFFIFGYIVSLQHKGATISLFKLIFKRN